VIRSIRSDYEFLETCDICRHWQGAVCDKLNCDCKFGMSGTLVIKPGCVVFPTQKIPKGWQI
jgi:hypothetical protein